jgi:hypothetical protein
MPAPPVCVAASVPEVLTALPSVLARVLIWGRLGSWER